MCIRVCLYEEKTSHLLDSGLTGEVYFSHCLYELLTLPVSRGAARQDAEKSSFHEIRAN